VNGSIPKDPNSISRNSEKNAPLFSGSYIHLQKYRLTLSLRNSEISIDFVQGPSGSRRGNGLNRILNVFYFLKLFVFELYYLRRYLADGVKNVYFDIKWS